MFKKIKAAAFMFALLCTPLMAKNKINIVTTIFPEYDWVCEIIGTNPSDIEVTFLMDKGVDLHSFQPSVKDIAKIRKCDLLVYVGGESDEWIEKLLEDKSCSKIRTVNLMDSLGDIVKEEEVVEGMQVEEEECEEIEYDEHVWLSLRNASRLCNIIADKISEIDKDNAGLYKANAEDYIAKLTALDARYSKVVASANKKTVLFGDRFPFRYLTDDYGLKYYAAFVGCSAESEASFNTIMFLANKMDELKLNCVITLEKSDNKIAGTIIKSTASKNQKILSLDSMQSVTSRDVKKGKKYLDIMSNNLQVLQEALR